MKNELILPDEHAIIDLGIADTVIAGLRGRTQDLEANTPTGYEAVRAAIAEARTLRGDVEKARKELKQSALEYGRRVDAEAKRVTLMIVEIEEPLKAKKDAVDNARAEAKRKAEEAERVAREEAERIKRAELEAARQKQLEEERIERERVAKEQAAERAKLLAEQAELRKQQEELAAERRKAEAERQAIEAERKRISDEAAAVERKKKEEAERKKREADEKKRKAEEEKQAKLAAAKAEAERKARMPDVDKIQCVATQLENIEWPSVSSVWGIERMQYYDGIVRKVITEMKAER